MFSVLKDRVDVGDCKTLDQLIRAIKKSFSPSACRVRVVLGGYDTTTQAVLDYLAADTNDNSPNAAWREPFDHLVKIMRSAMRVGGQRLFLPCDRYRVQFLDENGSEQQPARIEQEDWESIRWIEVWLWEKLAPWRRRSQAEILTAARAGVFRYLANDCRGDFLHEIDHRNTPRVRPSAPILSLDQPIDPDEDGDSAVNYLVKRAAVDPVTWIEENADEVERVAGKEAREVIAAHAAHHLLGEKPAPESLRQRWGIGLRQAQRRVQMAIDRLRGLRDEPIMRELYHVVDRYEHRYLPPDSARILSPEQKANKRLEEATRLMGMA